MAKAEQGAPSARTTDEWIAEWCGHDRDEGHDCICGLLGRFAQDVRAAAPSEAADARLRAAAPDLFAALAGLANALECPAAMKGRALVDVPKALESARAALAKAEGREASHG